MAKIKMSFNDCVITDDTIRELFRATNTHAESTYGLGFRKLFQNKDRVRITVELTSPRPARGRKRGQP